MYYISPSLLLIAMAFLVVIMIIPSFIYPKKFKDVVVGLTKNADYVRLGALWVLLLGFIYVSNYWKLDATWNLAISLTGWAMILKGIIGLRYPGYAAWKAKTFYSNKTKVYLIGILCILFAAFYIWVAYVKF